MLVIPFNESLESHIENYIEIGVKSFSEHSIAQGRSRKHPTSGRVETQHSIRAGLKASGHLPECKQDRFLFYAWLPRNPKGIETSRNFLREEVCWRVDTCFCVNGTVGEGQAEEHGDGAESQRVVPLPEHVRGSSYISKVSTGGTARNIRLSIFFSAFHVMENCMHYEDVNSGILGITKKDELEILIP